MQDIEYYKNLIPIKYDYEIDEEELTTKRKKHDMGQTYFKKFSK